MTARLRLATVADLVAINDIYNYYVPRSTCTYQLEPEPLEGRQAWFAAHPPDKYPVIVAELGSEASGGEVVGWGSLSKFRDRAAYDPTVEASVYIRHDHHREGLGELLLRDLIRRARELGYHSLIGGASAESLDLCTSAASDKSATSSASGSMWRLATDAQRRVTVRHAR
jgi:phosphinothricin acetyltransferase